MKIDIKEVLGVLLLGGVAYWLYNNKPVTVVKKSGGGGATSGGGILKSSALDNIGTTILNPASNTEQLNQGAGSGTGGVVESGLTDNVPTPVTPVTPVTPISQVPTSKFSGERRRQALTNINSHADGLNVDF